ncbi:hypothetical protein BS17DRAFT_360242 [Gyrodon lividus]|nr:hypothetical protein BS17DRAFT_360242 [Gyrodon lividus]
MMWARALRALVLPFILSVAHGQMANDGPSYLVALSETLNFYGLTTAEDLYNLLPGSGQGLYAANQAGNVTTLTLLAVPNATLAMVSNDTSFLLPYLLYNLIKGPGSINDTDIAPPPNHTMRPTMLNDPNFVTLENGKSQGIVVTRESDGSFHVLNQPTDVIIGPQGTLVFWNWSVGWANVSELLVVPTNFSSTAPTVGVGGFVESASTAGVLEMFKGQQGLTLFIPQGIYRVVFSFVQQ